MARQLFVNLPVKDLDKSVEFFTALGFSFNPDFTDENATCMIVNDDAFVMLLVEAYFKTFTSKAVADAQRRRRGDHVLLPGQPRGRRRAHPEGLTAGGAPSEEAQDYGFMYTHSFQDPDGHLWEVFWMDPAGRRRTQRDSDADRGPRLGAGRYLQVRPRGLGTLLSCLNTCGCCR